jgi:hypothetical protein
VRTFSQTWGITVGSAVIQNRMTGRLPAGIPASAYAVIELIPRLGPTERAEVRELFSRALRTLWIVLAGISAAALLSIFVFRMRECPMAAHTDERVGFERRQSDEGEDGVEKTSIGSGPG